MTSPQFWMVKSEPEAYAWPTFVKEGRTAWTGVRNFQARNNLRAMREGAAVLFYHSVSEKALVGVARVCRTAYPDPTASEGNWDCVDLTPVCPLPEPVTLASIKAHPELQELALLRQSRLSVIPVTRPQFDLLLRLGGVPEEILLKESLLP
jgi:predicted RNA-binding protein with PUA-like domain